MSTSKKNILVVGQVPPPLHGQSLMIQEFLNGKYDTVTLHHVRLNFSRSTGEIGSFQVRKLFVLLKTLLDIVIARWRTRAEILYFPPAGPTLNAVARDIFLLNGTRWLFRSTVFHFHAAGLLDIRPRLPWWLRPFFDRAYKCPDLAIVTTRGTASGISGLCPKSLVVLPYGISDEAASASDHDYCGHGSTPQILFMGILCEGKGVLTLIEACSRLHAAGLRFQVTCAGAFSPETFRLEVEDLIDRHGLGGLIRFPGVLTGQEKRKAFRTADIFCFPSHYHAESFGLVLVEAMSYGLPIVTTRWRGIPDVVGDSGGAFLVDPKRPDLVAEKLEQLLRDADLRASMGEQNRRWFTDRYTLETYRHGMEQALATLGA